MTAFRNGNHASSLKETGTISRARTVGRAVLAVAHRLGLKVPEDFSLAGFDDAPIARTVWPQLTTVRQKMELTGYTAIDFLVNPPTADARKRPQQHELVIRQTTARPKA